MKKARIIAALLATLMVIVAVSCKKPHVHDFKWEVEEAVTCTEKGTEVQICSECKEKGEAKRLRNRVEMKRRKSANEVARTYRYK